MISPQQKSNNRSSAVGEIITLLLIGLCVIYYFMTTGIDGLLRLVPGIFFMSIRIVAAAVTWTVLVFGFILLCGITKIIWFSIVQRRLPRFYFRPDPSQQAGTAGSNKFFTPGTKIFLLIELVLTASFLGWLAGRSGTGYMVAFIKEALLEGFCLGIVLTAFTAIIVGGRAYLAWRFNPRTLQGTYDQQIAPDHPLENQATYTGPIQAASYQADPSPKVPPSVPPA